MRLHPSSLSYFVGLSFPFGELFEEVEAPG